MGGRRYGYYALVVTITCKMQFPDTRGAEITAFYFKEESLYGRFCLFEAAAISPLFYLFICCTASFYTVTNAKKEAQNKQIQVTPKEL